VPRELNRFLAPLKAGRTENTKFERSKSLDFFGFLQDSQQGFAGICRISAKPQQGDAKDKAAGTIQGQPAWRVSRE
jgi:hypothetical protein